MLIGVKLDFGTDKETELIIDDPYIEVMPAYYVVRLPVTLDSPLFKAITIDYEVFQNEESLFDGTKNMEFAPMTKANLALSWQYEEIKKNETYTTKGKMSYKDQKGEEQFIEFESDFEYTGDENENNIGNVLKAPFESGGFPFWIIALVIIGLVIAIVMIRKRKISSEEYVLFNDDVEIVAVIDERHEKYESLQNIKDVKDEELKEYKHYYKKKYNKEKEVVYLYVRTEKNEE